MKIKLASSVAAAAVAFFSQAVFAQASAPATRADVKAEAKGGALMPPGEASPGQVRPQAPAVSSKSRSERKGETLSARDTGQLKPAGEKPNLKEEQAEKKAASTKTRADRKAEAKSAAKVPAGEAGPPAADTTGAKK